MSNHQNFDNFNLSDGILKSLTQSGYKTPSSIQQKCIPYLLNGEDVIGQAQTGTGKTAAFSLPLLDKIDVNNKNTQLLVLAPTRELAIQVSVAMNKYAKYIKTINILPIYGGQSYDIQLKALKKGMQVIVGTPGRIMDHIKRKTLKLNNIKALVLDEADEMLKMGFIDDVKWILGHIPTTRQIALFSATMPQEIKDIAAKFLKNPQIIQIKNKTETVSAISQKYLLVINKNKLLALKRILEALIFDGIIIFTRTKNDTTTINEQLISCGYKSAALNGDIAQKEREKTINNMKNNRIDIIVATDVAARGIDVARISHVINYDIPREVESYVHRIGRTGRAGRTGEAILFVSNKDLRMLKSIEKLTKQTITQISLPDIKEINTTRIANFKKNINNNLSQDLTELKNIIKQFSEDNDKDMLDIAASLAIMAQNGKPFLLNQKDEINKKDNEKLIDIKAKKLKKYPKIPMMRYRIEVGKRDKIKIQDIVNIITTQIDIDKDYLGAINLLDNFSTIDLPDEMPTDVINILKNYQIKGRKLAISKFNGLDNRNKKKIKRKYSNKNKKNKQKIKK